MYINSYKTDNNKNGNVNYDQIYGIHLNIFLKFFLKGTSN